MKKETEKWLNQYKGKVSDRDYLLLEKASDLLMNNIFSGDNYLWSPYRCISPDYTACVEIDNFNGIWNWDSAFHAIGVSRWDTQLGREQILGISQFQNDDGMIIDYVDIHNVLHAKSSKPPVMPWAAQIVYERDKNKEFLEEVYPIFIKNEKFWCEKRFSNGLFHYDADTNVTTFEEYDLNIRYESGWDNSVRWDKPVRDFWAIDLNCFMVMFYRSMAYFANELCKTDDAKIFADKEKVLVENIEKHLWNDEIKAYTDTNRFTGERSDVLTPASFMPLFIGIAPKDRAEYMAKLAADESKFYSGMPTVSYDNPNHCENYWRGPVWLNVAYFAIKGLYDYGYTEIANAMKETILGWVYDDGDCIHENYNGKTGKGLSTAHFSWSAVFVIEFILSM